MKKAKTWAIIFAVLTEILLCAMCVTVGFSYSNAICEMNHKGASAPPIVSLIVAIPFLVGIAITSYMVYFFYKKWREKQQN